jgi:membrane-associated protease RseP (regulator of RpoE activity)
MVDIGVISFIVFIGAIAIILYLKRNQLEFQGIIALTRTKKLRNTIYRLGGDYSGFWKIYFNIGIFATLILMVIGIAYMISMTLGVLSGSVTPAFGLVIPYPTSEISYSSGFLKVPVWLWVIAIPFVLIPHELSHGLALAANKLRIKSLGLLVLLFIPGAFVEPDEKQLKKTGKLQRLQVYCAGSFSNIVTGLILIVFSYLFLFAFYNTSDMYYNYPASTINQTDIISNMSLSNGIIELHTSNATYLVTQTILDKQQNKTTLVVLNNLPAARNNLSGILQEIGNTTIKAPKDVTLALSYYKPGDTVIVNTSAGLYNLTLADNNGSAYMGILVSQVDPLSGQNIMVGLFAPKNARPYEAKFSWFDPIGNFILQAISFTIAICIGVALFNMLPMKPLDGGAVFEALTNSMAANVVSVLILVTLLINFGAAFLG